jgi:WD40 repeat protein
MQVLSIGRKKRIQTIAFSPDGRELAAVCGDGQLRIWDTATGEVRKSVPIKETSGAYDVAYLGDGRLIFSGTDLLCWEMAADTWTVIMRGSGLNRQICISPDGRYLAAADQTTSTDWSGTNLAVYENAHEWKLLPEMEDDAQTTNGLAFSPDGRRLASGHIRRVGRKQRHLPTYGLYAPGHYTVNDYDYVVHLRQMPSGKVMHSLDGWQQGISHLAFSPDGMVLAGTAGPRLRIWDLESNREIALHKRGTKHFQGLCFTTDGRYLATVSNDETVRVWDARSWQEHTTITWQIGRLLNLAFAPDGLRAAAGSDRGQIVIWDLDI